MGKKYRVVFFIMLVVGLALLGWLLLKNSDIAVLSPRGTIAKQQRDLINIATLLSLIVVIPVFILTFFIGWKYRESNKKSKYTPDWDHNTKLEFFWWAIPSTIILILAVITWKSTHALDPTQPLSNAKPLTIQVIALQWKWLFIYPEQNIASVNFVQFPKDKPVEFEITADAPMNSFWIPQLGGQIYAMAGMSTHLNLMANQTGDFIGSSANLSGSGFADMKFTARASTQQEFETWQHTVQQSSNTLNHNEYLKLAQPGEHKQPVLYSAIELGLFDTIIKRFTEPSTGANNLYYEQSTPEHGTGGNY
jgi:cytochrome o ubiquinol oxidase subunit II